MIYDLLKLPMRIPKDTNIDTSEWHWLTRADEYDEDMVLWGGDLKIYDPNALHFYKTVEYVEGSVYERIFASPVNIEFKADWHKEKIPVFPISLKVHDAHRRDIVYRFVQGTQKTIDMICTYKTGEPFLRVSSPHKRLRKLLKNMRGYKGGAIVDNFLTHPMCDDVVVSEYPLFDNLLYALGHGLYDPSPQLLISQYKAAYRDGVRLNLYLDNDRLFPKDRLSDLLSIEAPAAKFSLSPFVNTHFGMYGLQHYDFQLPFEIDDTVHFYIDANSMFTAERCEFNQLIRTLELSANTDFMFYTENTKGLSLNELIAKNEGPLECSLIDRFNVCISTEQPKCKILFKFTNWLKLTCGDSKIFKIMLLKTITEEVFIEIVHQRENGKVTTDRYYVFIPVYQLGHVALHGSE